MKLSKTATPEPPEIEEEIEEQADLSAEEPEDYEELPEDDESEPADDAESEPAEADSEADDQPDEPADDESAPQAAQSTSDEPVQTEDFRFRADGRDVDVPGAFSAPFGIVIPHDAWEKHIQPHLADRTAWRRKEAEYQRKIETFADSHPEVIRARTLTAKVDALMKDPDTFYAFYEDFQRNKKIFELEVKLETHDAVRTATTQQDTAQRSQAEEDEVVSMMDAGMKAGIRHVLSEDAFKSAGLDAEKLYLNLWNDPMRNNFFFRAKAGDGSGLEPGQLGINLVAVRHRLEPLAERQVQARKDVAKVAGAARRNTAAVSKSKAPQTVSAKSSDTPAGQSKEPASYDEWVKSLSRAAKE